MAKRFTDTEKWSHAWFRKLTPKMKTAWIYLCDKCSHSGIWNVDFEALSFNIGEKITQEECDSAFGPKLQTLQQDKIFIPSFISFQYGELDQKNRVHKSVVDNLKKEGAYELLEGAYESSEGCKDKDKDKYKYKDKDKDKDKETKRDDVDSLNQEFSDAIKRVRSSAK